MSYRCPFCGKPHEKALWLNGFPFYECEKTPAWTGFFLWVPKLWEDALKGRKSEE